LVVSIIALEDYYYCGSIITTFVEGSMLGKKRASQRDLSKRKKIEFLHICMNGQEQASHPSIQNT
jgi:hypothetical protein